MSANAWLVSGLGFGDEGKGTITEYLVHDNKAILVIRYNGGSQAAHSVVRNDGTHHTFSQFGSGTYEGAKTFLSRFVLVNPLSILNEAKHLEETGVKDPLSLLAVDRRAPLITQYHRATNRIFEYARGGARYGSCGEGIGEVMKDYLKYGDQVPLVGDIEDYVTLTKKLNFTRDLKHAEIEARGIQLSTMAPDMHQSFELFQQRANTAAERFFESRVRIRLVDSGYLGLFINHNIVFEGAQGILLDQDYGFQPHTTWTNITFENANTLLHEMNFSGEVTRVGVTRTYSTRHGAGPLVTEEVNGPVNPYEHNGSGSLQGNFRSGPLDLVLLRYALEVIGGVDSLAITHMDIPQSKVCTSYDVPDEYAALIKNGLVHKPRKVAYKDQEVLNTALVNAKPNYMPIQPDEIVSIIENATKTPADILSSGPRLANKHRPVPLFERSPYMHQLLT
jgi:adenylosuccinate synthase